MPFDSESFTLPEAPTLPTTPKARVAYLRDFLRDVLPDAKFFMRGTTISFDEEAAPECGSPVCIAGWTVRLFKIVKAEADGWGPERRALGLERGTETKLFTPDDWFADPERYTRLRAVRVLDIMLETWDELGGPRVDWEAAIRDVPA